MSSPYPFYCYTFNHRYLLRFSPFFTTHNFQICYLCLIMLCFFSIRICILCPPLKFNAILASCLCSILSVLSFTPIVCLEVEYVCPPLEVKSRWLTVKFLLKSLLSSVPLFFHIFVYVLNSRQYVIKTLPILSSITSLLYPFISIILCPHNRPFLLTFFLALSFQSPEFLSTIFFLATLLANSASYIIKMS